MGELTRRRENKAKAELAGKTDRVMQLRQEIAENERQLDMAQENFEKISRIIKKEFETFDVKKCKDFKDTITLYLENMLKSQESLVTHWERFLPEIKNMELSPANWSGLKPMNIQIDNYFICIFLM